MPNNKEAAIVCAMSRLVGFVKGVIADTPVLDDDKQDYIDRIRAGLRDEAERAEASLEVFMSEMKH